MNCDEIRDLIADHLDDLLDAPIAATVDKHLAACPACEERAREVSVLRGILYEKDEVGPPPPDLPWRVRAAASRRRRGSRLMALVRYAAVFLAGVGATFAVRPEPGSGETPTIPIVAEMPPVAGNDFEKPSEPRVPRRIR